jgi:hypothetical protein
MTMGRMVTIEISEEAARRAQETAVQSDRRVEEVLAEWIDRLATNPPVDSLPDDQILALCRSELGDSQQDELGKLLNGNREGILTAVEQARLDELMQVYRRGLVRKAQAFQVAVARELMPALG